MPTLIGILGSVTPPGRLLRALSLGLDDARDSARPPRTEILNLADFKLGFADGRPVEELEDDTAAVVRAIAAADAVVLASPVYRASVSGALKNLLDLTPFEALHGKPCGIVAMGATPHHYLGVDSQLRAVLAWFGALVAPNSVYLSSADFASGEPSASARSDMRELMATVLRLHEAVSASGESLGPPPLAGRYV
jgi:FMN reductase